jgi:UDP-N-acetylglucosamine transferase subunit ALG13
MYTVGDLEKGLAEYLNFLEGTIRGLDNRKENLPIETIDTNAKELISQHEKMNTIIRNLNFAGKSEAMLNDEITQLEAANQASISQYKLVKAHAGKSSFLEYEQHVMLFVVYREGDQ